MVTSTDALASPLLPTPAELTLIAAGDQDSCSDLVSRWDTVVLNIAAGHTHRHADRDDLAQAGRLAVIRAARGYDPDRGDFNHYTTRAIRRAVIRESNRLNHQRRLDHSPLDDNPEAIDQLVTGGDRAATLVTDWIDTLADQQQRLYQLIYVHGMTQREAAVHMGISQPRVAQLRFHLLTLGALALAC